MFPRLNMSYNSNYLPNAPTFKDHHMENENHNKHEEEHKHRADSHLLHDLLYT